MNSIINSIQDPYRKLLLKRYQSSQQNLPAIFNNKKFISTFSDFNYLNQEKLSRIKIVKQNTIHQQDPSTTLAQTNKNNSNQDIQIAKLYNTSSQPFYVTDRKEINKTPYIKQQRQSKAIQKLDTFLHVEFPSRSNKNFVQDHGSFSSHKNEDLYKYLTRIWKANEFILRQKTSIKIKPQSVPHLRKQKSDNQKLKSSANAIQKNPLQEIDSHIEYLKSLVPFVKEFQEKKEIKQNGLTQINICDINKQIELMDNQLKKQDQFINEIVNKVQHFGAKVVNLVDAAVFCEIINQRIHSTHQLREEILQAFEEVGQSRQKPLYSDKLNEIFLGSTLSQKLQETNETQRLFKLQQRKKTTLKTNEKTLIKQETQNQENNEQKINGMQGENPQINDDIDEDPNQDELTLENLQFKIQDEDLNQEKQKLQQINEISNKQSIQLEQSPTSNSESFQLKNIQQNEEVSGDQLTEGKNNKVEKLMIQEFNENFERINHEQYVVFPEQNKVIAQKTDQSNNSKNKQLDKKHRDLSNIKSYQENEEDEEIDEQEIMDSNLEKGLVMEEQNSNDEEYQQNIENYEENQNRERNQSSQSSQRSNVSNIKQNQEVPGYLQQRNSFAVPNNQYRKSSIQNQNYLLNPANIQDISQSNQQTIQFSSEQSNLGDKILKSNRSSKPPSAQNSLNVQQKQKSRSNSKQSAARDKSQNNSQHSDQSFSKLSQNIQIGSNIVESQNGSKRSLHFQQSAIKKSENNETVNDKQMLATQRSQNKDEQNNGNFKQEAKKRQSRIGDLKAAGNAVAGLLSGIGKKNKQKDNFEFLDDYEKQQQQANQFQVDKDKQDKIDRNQGLLRKSVMGDNNIQRVSKINPPNISNKKAIIQSPDESEDDLDEANVANQNNEKQRGVMKSIKIPSRQTMKKSVQLDDDNVRSPIQNSPGYQRNREVDKEEEKIQQQKLKLKQELEFLLKFEMDDKMSLEQKKIYIESMIRELERINDVESRPQIALYKQRQDQVKSVQKNIQETLEKKLLNNDAPSNIMEDFFQNKLKGKYKKDELTTLKYTDNIKLFNQSTTQNFDTMQQIQTNDFQIHTREPDEMEKIIQRKENFKIETIMLQLYKSFVQNFEIIAKQEEMKGKSEDQGLQINCFQKVGGEGKEKNNSEEAKEEAIDENIEIIQRLSSQQAKRIQRKMQKFKLKYC